MNILKFIPLCLLICTMNAFSYNIKNTSNNSLPSNGKMIYCPDNIACEADDDINSCFTNGGDKAAWAKLNIANHSEHEHVKKGIYDFKGVNIHRGRTISYYEDTSVAKYVDVPGNVICIYSNDSCSDVSKSSECRSFFLANIKGARMVPSITRSEDWYFNKETSSNGFAYCYAVAPSLCPLTEVSSLSFMAGAEFQKIYMRVRSDKIDLFRVVGDFMPYTEYLYKVCDDEKRCPVTIIGEKQISSWETKQYIIGMVYIDITDNMKIVGVAQDNKGSQYGLVKDEFFNVMNLIKETTA